MAPGRRAETLSTLTEALVQQFGSKSRDLVEAQVTQKLAGTKRITKQDLDVVEQSILAAAKERRRAQRSSPVARSLPEKPGLGRLQPSQSSPALSLPAPAKRGDPRGQSFESSGSSLPAAVSPQQPQGQQEASHTTGLSRSASAAQLRTAPKAPYAAIPPKFMPETPRSAAVECVPKYPVPLKPLLKPVDHWDLVIQFDAAKHHVASRQKVDKQRPQARFRAGLNAQRRELQQLQEERDLELVAEREHLNNEIARARADEEEEWQRAHAKKAQIKRDAFKELADIEAKRQREQEKKRKEGEAMTRWLAMETQEAKDIRDLRRQQHHDRMVEAQMLQKQHEEEKIFRKEQIRAEDRAFAQAAIDELNAREAKEAALKAAREERIRKIMSTMGKALGQKMANEEAELEARIARIVEEGDRAAAEDARRRRETHNRRVQECHVARQRQVAQKNHLAVLEQEANARQAEIFRQQSEAFAREEKEKIARLRKARQNIDETLVEQMRESAPVHLEHFGITPEIRKAEVSMNKAVFEQMVREGYATEQATALLREIEGAAKGAGLHPSVPPYEGEIHPLELEEPPL